MSAQNLQDKKQIQRKEMKLAMSVGNSRHYHIHQIQPRHYRQTADRAGLPDGMADMALDQIADALPGAIEIVCAALPSGFPADVRDSIASGALQRRNVIATAAA
jgi:serine/threonine-protein kinase HipA